MPTYEYRCRECGHEVEAVQSFTDEPLTTCPSCGGALRKKFGAPGIAFKGSGFYKTDSRPSKSAPKPAETTKSDKGAGDASKPAASNGSSTSPASSTPSTSPTSSPAKDS